MEAQVTESSDTKATYEDKPRSVSSPSLRHDSDEEGGELDALAIPAFMVKTKWQRLANKLEAASGAEARGIERVDESMRLGKTSARDYLNMATTWFSINLTANILTIGVLGPVAFGLGTIDSMLCCLFGTVFGSMATCYIATFGPISGNRTLVTARFSMGWWPTKLCVILALVVILGYGLVDAIITGLIFSAVSGGKMSVIVGIVIFAIIVWTVSSFGIKYFNYFEQYAYIPQVCALFVLVGCSAPYMDNSVKSQLTGSALAGSRLSYLFVCASGLVEWSCSAKRTTNVLQTSRLVTIHRRFLRLPSHLYQPTPPVWVYFPRVYGFKDLC
jgi:hypothetical protein